MRMLDRRRQGEHQFKLPVAQATSASRDKRRALIADISASLFDKVGYHATSLASIALETGLGKSTLPHYFESKMAILHHIFTLHIDALEQDLKDDGTGEPAADFALMCASIIRQTRERPHFASVYSRYAHILEGEFQGSIDQRKLGYASRVNDVFERMAASDELVTSHQTIATNLFLSAAEKLYEWYGSVAAQHEDEQIAALLYVHFRRDPREFSQ